MAQRPIPNHVRELRDLDHNQIAKTHQALVYLSLKKLSGSSNAEPLDEGIAVPLLRMNIVEYEYTLAGGGNHFSITRGGRFYLGTLEQEIDPIFVDMVESIKDRIGPDPEKGQRYQLPE